jgi:hypothetical protein
MPNEKCAWKKGMMEHWNIGLKKIFLNIIPSFQHSIAPEDL